MKFITLVGDGMGDHPLTELGGRTPLEVANIPRIDDLCRRGEFFLNRTVPEGYPPGSDVANMSLLGYDPRLYYSGRAPLEAAAIGLSLAKNEIVYRCNLVTLEKRADELILKDFSAGSISSEEGATLLADLRKRLQIEGLEEFFFSTGMGYRNILVVKRDYPRLTTIPPHDHIGQDVSKYWAQYQDDPHWQRLLKVVEEVFTNHPVNHARHLAGKNQANMIWLWGEGGTFMIPTLTERFGISGAMVSAVDLLKGLGIAASLATPDIKGATGYLDTNYEGKVEAALTALETMDFVFIHLEAADEAGHRGDLRAKIQAIEDIDNRVMTPLLTELRRRGEAFRLLFTMDHFTPLALRTHTAEPVPTLLYDSREEHLGSGCNFSERECREHAGRKGQTCGPGFEVMAKLLLKERR
ncbi:cofactor-independent phosphoglycerate mutase [Desulfotalea psychrophila]|uniref:Probable phosphonopyruvate decarboxylase n=1 Tax=Desulfotalea psychrophila (strain LSv54 / DSM 12343) TaxID=177439 RepID=Q6AMG5_DESPS|nr:cofactor-independent phosphoglycerate mutase [Desulfotalea psychrophila]CAG36460.1 probable phosphonopyruvate decarboxylase [Desulfotalea psychrophila LSv54]